MFRLNKLILLAAAMIVLTGCAIDASSPIERIEPDRFTYYGPVTHEIVCRCTCRSDSGNRRENNSETHAYPANGGCAVLNTAQCELEVSNGYGKLEGCFEKSVRIPD